MTAIEGIAVILALVGSGALGFTVGARRERVVARADAAKWRELALELQQENRRLRCECTPVPGAGEPPSGKPNALYRLRQRLNVSVHELARRLGVPVADAETLEYTRFGLLDIDAVERHTGALGCRLDVVAVHIEGEAVWLSDERGAS
jgi:hypothetical protein